MAALANEMLERETAVADDALALIKEAHQRAVEAEPSDVAQHMIEVFGQNLTALMAGVENRRTVARWVRGQESHPSHLARLRDAYMIATFLELATSRQTVQAWFMGMNPYLGDRAPALVLANGLHEGARVMRAARSFLAHG